MLSGATSQSQAEDNIRVIEYIIFKAKYLVIFRHYNQFHCQKDKIPQFFPFFLHTLFFMPYFSVRSERT